MGLLRRLKHRFQHLMKAQPVCPSCGSGDVTLRLTEWMVGTQTENAGRTSFRRLCSGCGHEWQQNT